jgi:hypothetical protein
MDKHTERIERFNNLKYTKNQSEWEHCVTTREEDLYDGVEVDDTLDIMEILDEYYEKISNKLSEHGHSRGSTTMLQSMIRHFHKCSNTIQDF